MGRRRRALLIGRGSPRGEGWGRGRAGEVKVTGGAMQRRAAECSARQRRAAFCRAARQRNAVLAGERGAPQ